MSVVHRLILSGGETALVDRKDWDRLQADARMRGKWRLARLGDRHYVVRSVRFGQGAKSPPTLVYLSRVIIGAKPGERVKFRNGDALDCRRENLFIKGEAHA